jgi:hypothetical protein
MLAWIRFGILDQDEGPIMSETCLTHFRLFDFNGQERLDGVYEELPTTEGVAGLAKVAKL